MGTTAQPKRLPSQWESKESNSKMWRSASRLSTTFCLIFLRMGLKNDSSKQLFIRPSSMQNEPRTTSVSLAYPTWSLTLCTEVTLWVLLRLMSSHSELEKTSKREVCSKDWFKSTFLITPIKWASSPSQILKWARSRNSRRKNIWSNWRKPSLKMKNNQLFRTLSNLSSTKRESRI